jgi:hypothetical protein
VAGAPLTGVVEDGERGGMVAGKVAEVGGGGACAAVSKGGGEGTGIAPEPAGGSGGE